MGNVTQGKHACASLPVDLKLAEATKMHAIPRVAPGPAGAGTFQMHSRPGATKVIYLDFDGHVTQNTPWNQVDPTITTTPYDIDGNPGTFNAVEQANILEIWQRVAETYIPFDVDVTTEAPAAVADLINTGGGDTKWGMRAVFGDSNPSPAPGAGGVAYVGSFGWDVGTGADVPCFALQAGLSAFPKYNADGACHELGHTLGLNHDGLFPASDPKHVEYYQGQGAGKVAWAPVMGVGYYVPLVQFSKGEYQNASNTEDDLKIISTQNGFGLRPDDHANSSSGAKAIGGTAGANVFAVNQSGIVETRTDSDWFKITAGAGTLILNAVGGPANTMLDIQMDLYDSKGVLVVSSNPPTDVIASINQTIVAGTYYVKIDGVGLGDPLVTGYTDYSSLGQYNITGSFSTKGLVGQPVIAGTGTLAYGILQTPKPIDTVIKISYSKPPTLASATVQVTNFVKTEDVLSLAADSNTMGNITASFDKATGILTLTSAGATATLAQFQTALRAVSYANSSSKPSLTTRQVAYQVNDGTLLSNVVTSTVSISYVYVVAKYDKPTNTLLLTDDNVDDSVLITLRGTYLTVEGAGGTRIGTSASNSQSVAFTCAAGVIVNCQFTGGNDTISMVGLQSSKTMLVLGDGNDTVKLTYCNITNLSIDGGPGLDTLSMVGNKFTNQPVITNVP